LQEPYGDVTYRIIGDDNAGSYFQIDAESGRITVRRSLNEDSSEVYRVGVLFMLWNLYSSF